MLPTSSLYSVQCLGHIRLSILRTQHSQYDVKIACCFFQKDLFCLLLNIISLPSWLLCQLTKDFFSPSSTIPGIALNHTIKLFLLSPSKAFSHQNMLVLETEHSSILRRLYQKINNILYHTLPNPIQLPQINPLCQFLVSA